MSLSYLKRFGLGRATSVQHSDNPATQQDEAETADQDASHLPVEDQDFAEIWERCRKYTMTSFSRGLALYRALRYVAQNHIEGDFIECGVWRGGSTMIAMSSLRHFGVADKRICLFDTFDGMTAPSSADVDIAGAKASDLIEANPDDPAGIICRASLEEVRENLGEVDYPQDLIEFYKGDVAETLGRFSKRTISILRLDTDFYESTRTELAELYPMLQQKGVLIVDDYGHWRGARKAVDEYFDDMRLAGEVSPLMSIVDYTGRMGIK